MTQGNRKQTDSIVPNNQNTTSQLEKSEQSSPTPYQQTFDQSVILRQSPKWPKITLLTILGVVTLGIIWSYFAKIEQAVDARGQLQPKGEVKKVQSPINGVIRELATNDQGETFEEGDYVEKGDVLLHYDSKPVKDKIESLQEIRQSFREENSFYRKIMNQAMTSSQAVATEIDRLDIPNEVAMLASNRIALKDENNLYRRQLGLAESDENLTQDARERLAASSSEAKTRRETARLKLQQARTQLEEVKVELANAKTQLETEQAKFDELSPLMEDGAIAKVRYVEQKQTVQKQQAKVDQLKKKKERLKLEIERAQEQLENTQATTEKNVLDRIAENKQQIAQIDTQLTKTLRDNQQRISEINSQISELEQQTNYQNLEAPKSGTIFDLKVGSGSSVNKTEMLMKIVPQKNLVAEVYIKNKDIGFVREGMNVDVRIDSFPFSEYGDIQGKLISIGSDALPPNKNYDFYRFPAKIRLDHQFLKVQDRKIPLQSGMSISSNIKLREDRRVISLIIERFTKEFESLKNVR